MQIIQTNSLSQDQQQAAYSLWNNEYPASLSYNTMSDFDQYLIKLAGQKHYLLICGEKIEGWAFDFIRDDEKWFALIISGGLHGKGLGTLLLEEVKKNNSRISGWVIDHDGSEKSDGSKYKSPLTFYLKNGFTALQDVRLKTDKISAIKIGWPAAIETKTR